MHCQRSLFSFARLAGSRRPPVRWRAAHQTLLAVELFKPVARSLRSPPMATAGTRVNKPGQASAARLRCTCSPVSINPWFCQFIFAQQFGQPKRCGLTLRSKGRAPACHLAREAVLSIIGLAGQAPYRRAPLSSNVRPHREANLREGSASGNLLQMQKHRALGTAVSAWLMQ
jgi:hypothetical protein